MTVLFLLRKSYDSPCFILFHGIKQLQKHQENANSDILQQTVDPVVAGSSPVAPASIYPDSTQCVPGLPKNAAACIVLSGRM
jgi:hypothetical protein